MKKNCIGGRGIPILQHHFFPKIFTIMKISFLITLLTTLQVTASVYSQNAKLTIDIQNMSLSDAIKSIEEQSAFRFFYSDNYRELDEKVSISVSDKNINEVLADLFKEKGLTYKILENNIIVIAPAIAFQQNKITGLVTDAQTGEPLPGVTVIVDGTSNGTATDINGNYSLDVSNSEVVLSFSYIGYISEKVAVSGQKKIDVKLIPDIKKLDEVVVVGYGVQKKESVVGAITQVDNKALMRAGTPDVTNAIAGKLSGVLTIQQTGQPGESGSEIVIRGLSSWNKDEKGVSSKPLILVDGVERDFSTMDPNEINTISVLKDASATAVYGAKGANGVIIVTSKRGSIGKPQLYASASTGLQWATALPEHISSYATMSMYNVAMMNQKTFDKLIPQSALNEYKNPSSRLNALRYPDVNWFDEVTNKFAPTVNANINVQGGTKFVKYFASLGYMHQGSLFDAYHNGVDDARYKFNRFNYRTNLDFSLTKTTTLSVNVGGEVGIKNQPSNASWHALYATSPARFPAYYPAWVLEEVPDLNYPDATGMRLAKNVGEFTANPFSTFYDGSFRMYNESKLFTDLILNQKLDVITKGLSFNGKVSLSTYYQSIDKTAGYSFPQYTLDFTRIGTNLNPWTRDGETADIYVMNPLDINVGGLENNYYKNLYYEFALNYNRTFGSHYVTALALLNRSQNDQNTAFPYYNEAVVGRTTYDFKHKYLVELNMGYTGSERFSPSNRFGFFPSVALGWTVSEEAFFKKAVPWMNKLKFRYSDGLTGSDAAANRWLYMSSYYKDGSGSIVEDKIPNKSAQWERARKRDLGMEIGILNSLITLTVDVFDEKRDKMLLTPNTTTFLIGSDFKELNLGEMKKHGIEVEVEYNKTTQKGFNYWVRGIFGFNENRVLFKDDPIKTPEYQKAAGKPLGAQTSGVTLTGSGYFTSVDDIHNNPAPTTNPIDNLVIGDYKYLDYNADGVVNQFDKHAIKGNMYPPVTYSFSSGFHYKRWEFSFMFQGNAGKYVDFKQTFESEFYKGNWSVHKSQVDYWTPSNLGATHSTLHYSTDNVLNLSWGGGEAYGGYDTKIEKRFWRNADYLRLKEVYLSYSFAPAFLKKSAGISGLSIYATGNNLLTFTDLIEGDPERKDFGDGYYPQLSSVVFGVKLSF